MRSAQPVADAFFMKGARGDCFCLFHQPVGGLAARGGLLYIHPFAEEMNLSRRMAAAQARVFASAGFAVLQIDLYGCGDSAGDFGDAHWDIWCDDVALAQAWLAARVAGPVWLWGLRSGGLLAAQVARQSPSMAAQLLLWQPVFSGQQLLSQFLRLSLTANMTRGVRAVSRGELAQALMQGESVEVAGYRLSPQLAHGMSSATLDGLNTGTQVVCIEMSHASDASISPALAAQVTRWQAAGCHAVATAIDGPAFWQVAESSLCPALLAASQAAVTNPMQALREGGA